MRTPARSLDPQPGFQDAARQTTGATPRPGGSLISPQAFGSGGALANASVPDDQQIEEAVSGAQFFLTSGPSSSVAVTSGKKAKAKTKSSVNPSSHRVQKPKASSSAVRPRPKVKAFKNLKAETQEHRKHLIAIVRSYWPEFDDIWPYFPNVPLRAEGEVRDVRECSDAFLTKLAELASLCPDNIDEALKQIDISLGRSKEPFAELNEQILSRTCFRLDEMPLRDTVDADASAMRERSMTAVAPTQPVHVHAPNTVTSSVVPLADNSAVAAVSSTVEPLLTTVIDMTRSTSPLPHGSLAQTNEHVSSLEAANAIPVVKSEAPLAAEPVRTWTREDQIKREMALKRHTLEMMRLEGAIMTLEYELDDNKRMGVAAA